MYVKLVIAALAAAQVSAEFWQDEAKKWSDFGLSQAEQWTQFGL